MFKEEYETKKKGAPKNLGIWLCHLHLDVTTLTRKNKTVFH